APNIIPEFAAATFYVRSASIDAMWQLEKRVVQCAEGAARATGCQLKVTEHRDTAYEPMKRNATLLEAFRANLRTLGVTESPEIKDRLGSSDIGNVSQVIPAIQPMMKIAPDGTPIHSLAFKEEQAHAWLTELLAKHGAKVERSVGGLATAFRATLEGAGRGPTIAIMAEYDALPGIGHACGHNVIATAGTGAGVALAVAL